MNNKWRSQLEDAVLLDPLILVHGNVKDVFLLNSQQRGRLPTEMQENAALTIDVVLALELEAAGLDAVVVYDPVAGMRIMRGSMHSKIQKLLSGGASVNAPPATAVGSPVLPSAQAPAPSADAWLTPSDLRLTPFDFLRTVQTQLFADPSVRVGVICQFVDRYLPFSERQDAADRQLSMVIQKTVMGIRPKVSRSNVGSRLVLVFDLEGQVPQELNTLFPFSRSVLVPPPTLEDRETFFREFHHLFDSGSEIPVDLSNDSEQCRLAGQLSDGLKMQDLFSLAMLSRREHLGLGSKQLPHLLTRFKFGTRENAWSNVSADTLQHANERLSIRVKGQAEVIQEVVPVLIRAKLGMTDIAGKTHSSKPRGVFFFVGPTGVGKTELGKAIAELVFGNEQALLRFDMSEYSEEHQQARLVGSPPGYVGFDQGGQLTNAISEKPFSVVLFDEIEKAHERILDKFLQVLDDGRLTDGMGKTVYFTESILIFTSNLGTRTPNARVTEGSVGLHAPGGYDHEPSTADTYNYLRSLSYPQLSDHFRNAVKHYFVEKLGRPEILNRIGEENILVFRFLTDDGAKKEIIDQQIANMHAALQEQHQVKIYCTKSFKKILSVHPGGFDRNGARGVKNLLNRFVLNHLAPELLIRGDQCRGRTLRVDYEMAEDRIAGETFDAAHLKHSWIDE